MTPDKNLPPEAELLGATTAPLTIQRNGARTVVKISAGIHLNRGRVYVSLENVRGTQDAAVLEVWVSLAAAPLATPPPSAGSAALYGLRRASRAPDGNQGAGLSFTFDVTAQLPAGTLAEVDEVQVSITTDQPLFDSAGLTIGRVSIFQMPAE